MKGEQTEKINSSDQRKKKNKHGERLTRVVYGTLQGSQQHHPGFSLAGPEFSQDRICSKHFKSPKKSLPITQVTRICLNSRKKLLDIVSAFLELSSKQSPDIPRKRKLPKQLSGQ